LGREGGLEWREGGGGGVGDGDVVPGISVFTDYVV
jgi:hypothetical protein